MRTRSTGVDIIDEVLGGITPGLPCVLAGPSGSGRTVLSLQLAAAGIEQGRVVSLLCNEPAPLLLRQASTLGLDLVPAIENERLALLEMDADVAAITTALGSEALIEAIRTEQPLCSLLIVDPLSVVTAGIFDEAQLRAVARGLVSSAPDWMIALTVESERLALQQGLERILGEVCGAFLELTNVDGERRLTVEKTRTGVPRHPYVRFEVGEGGTRLLDEPPSPARPRSAARPEQPADRPMHAHESDAASRDPVDAHRPALAGPTTRPAAARLADDDEHTPVVLVVDSDRQSRDQIVKWLEGRYEVIQAEDGFEAMTALMSRSPDLVILDLVMPRVSGFELLSAIQRSGQMIPRLVISGSLVRAGDRLAPLVLGATDLLAKPLERFELLLKAEMLLRLEGETAPLMDPVEAEGLFARISKTRLLSKEDFEARLGRACSLGDRLGLPSSIVAVSSTSSRTLDQFLAASDESLRFEDATLRVSQRRAVILLVATEHEDAPGATERLCDAFGRGGGRADQLTLRIQPAQRVGSDFAWHSLFRGGRAEADDEGEGDGEHAGDGHAPEPAS